MLICGICYEDMWRMWRASNLPFDLPFRFSFIIDRFDRCMDVAWDYHTLYICTRALAGWFACIACGGFIVLT